MQCTCATHPWWRSTMEAPAGPPRDGVFVVVKAVIALGLGVVIILQAGRRPRWLSGVAVGVRTAAMRAAQASACLR
jgi:hypothetical protein